MPPVATRSLATLLLLMSASTAPAIIINSEWNTADGYWNVAANWDPVDVPDNASGRNHHVKIGNRPIAAGAVVTFITEDQNFDIVTTMAISNGAEWFSNSWHLEVFGLTTVDGPNSKIRIGPHENHHAEAFRSFNLTLSNGAALLLNDAAVTVDFTLDVKANATLEGPGELTGDDIYFRTGSQVVSPDMIHLNVGTTHVEAGAVFSGEGGLHITAGSNFALSDGADVHLMVENHGTLSIGAGTPAQASGDHYHQDATGQWNVDIFGPIPDEFDRLALHYDAHLAGTLELSVGNEFVPALGSSFEILSTEGNVIGEFDLIVQPPTLPADLAIEVRYHNQSVELVVVNALPGDFNLDGTVDAADYVVWLKTFGEPVPIYSSADANGDGTIDNNDYVIWRAHFGQNSGSGAGASTNATVPEPANLVLIMFAAVGLCLRRSWNA